MCDGCLHTGEILGLPVIMIVGKEEKNLEKIAKSYSTARRVRSFQGFREKKEIYYYEEEMQIHTNGIMLCKKNLDILLNAIEQNNHAEIMKAVDGFYEEMRERGIAGEVMRLNINYLLFQLLHLASELDDSVNQEEILRMISEGRLGFCGEVKLICVGSHVNTGIIWLKCVRIPHEVYWGK